MIKIEETMEPNALVLNKEDIITEAAKLLSKNNINGVPLVGNNKFIGILSEGDIMKLLYVYSPNSNLVLISPLDVIKTPIRMKHEYNETVSGIKRASLTPVKEIMISQIITIGPQKGISDALVLMDDDNNLIGIVTRGDIVKSLVNYKVES